MKKVILTLAIALAALTANAQDAATKMWVGGNVGFSSVSVKDAVTSKTTTTSTFAILPEFGYNLTNNLALAIDLGYKKGQVDGLAGIQKGFVVNPFVRYSFLKGKIGCAFIDGGVDYSSMKADGVSGASANNVFFVGFRPGVAFNVTRSLSLAAHVGQIGYTHATGGVSNIDFGLNFASATFGLAFNF